jgi:hypothetical protein
MKSIIKVIIFAALFSQFSCKETAPDSESVKVIDVEKLAVNNLFSFKRPIDNCRFVALETTDECLLGDIKKVVIENDLIFVHDENQKLFVFDKTGKYLNQIGIIGQSNEELLSFMDFYVNKDRKYVGIYDVYKGQILRYNFNGQYIGSFNCPKDLGNIAHFVGLKGGDLLVSMRNYSNNYSKSLYNYIVLNENDYSLKAECLPFSVIGSVSRTPTKSSTSDNNEGLYVTAFLSDTIYRLSANKSLEPILVIKSSQFKIADTKLIESINDMKLEVSSDAISILRKRGFFHGLYSVFATDDFLRIEYPLPEYQVCDIFYNLKTGAAYKSVTLRTDFFGQSWSNAIASTDTEKVYALQPERIIELRESTKLFKDKKVLNALTSVREFDNPVLAFFTSGY